MSDPKRASFITVGAPKSAKKNVTKTVRLTVNLDESNESKYPELNYKELVIGEEKKHKIPNGKPVGLDPFSDNDDDVERVARKFEQKYGSKSTYGSKGRSKQDEYADIGAGYDENDSFIDNTDGYDEMIPPGCDTLYGGFYINCGSLEFKAVPDNQNSMSDGEPGNGKRNKRRLSSSTSADESSDSSSESESQDEKDKPMINGTLDSHKTEHRKKKNKKPQKNAKRIRRADSSAATSGKQTSDDNRDGESADSRTSHSDSLTSKPAPSSENPVTSDSSRDATEIKLPASITTVLDEISSCVARLKQSTATPKDIETATDIFLPKLEKAVSSVDARTQRIAWDQATRVLGSNPPISKRLRMLNANSNPNSSNHTSSVHVPHQVPLVAPEKKKAKPDQPPALDISNLTDLEREAKILETLDRLKTLIDEKRPAIMQNYQYECSRVQEERKKQVENAPEGGPLVEKRLPKRRFPWCLKSRGLLAELTRLSGDDARAALLLAQRALPLFPAGFVRIPTLMRQANLSRDVTAHIKPSDLKKHLHRPLTTPNIPIPPVSQTPSVPQSPTAPQTPTVSQTPIFNEPIHFPSSLTVTTTNKPDPTPEIDEETKKSKHKHTKNPNSSKESQLPTIFNSFSLSKEVTVECKNGKDEKFKTKENLDKHVSDNDKYLNSKGSFTITPVPSNDSKSAKLPTVNTSNDKKEHSIRVKSQATLMKEADELAKKDKDHSKHKHKEKTHVSKPVEKRINTPLHIDTTFHKDKTKSSDMQKSSPNLVKNRLEEPKKPIDNVKKSENNLPRPGLVPVHHSPTFAKPDKRAPDPKKPKKDIVIISDMDPLAENVTEPLAVDDSSSDVEVIGEEIGTAIPAKTNESVPSKHTNNNKKSDVTHNSVLKTVMPEPIKEINQVKRNNQVEKMDVDDTAEADINKVMQNLREMQDSQDHFTSNSFGGVITSEQTSFNNMDGCNKDDSTSSEPTVVHAEKNLDEKNI